MDYSPKQSKYCYCYKDTQVESRIPRQWWASLAFKPPFLAFDLTPIPFLRPYRRREVRCLFGTPLLLSRATSITSPLGYSNTTSLLRILSFWICRWAYQASHFFFFLCNSTSGESSSLFFHNNHGYRIHLFHSPSTGKDSVAYYSIRWMCCYDSKLFLLSYAVTLTWASSYR